MRKMGFANIWIEIIMKHVLTVSYSLLMNGCPYIKFKLSRSIRQGDPFSPYLFIHCSKALITCLTKLKMLGTLLAFL